MNTLTIGDVARYTGLETSAIRYYESQGLLPIPTRVHGHRRYDASILKRLGLILLLRQASFGIRDIQALFHTANDDLNTTASWQRVAAQKMAELDTIIAKATVTKAWLAEALNSDCDSVEDCIAITYDDEGDGKMEVTLSCINLTAKSSEDPAVPIKLVTFPS